MNFVRPVLISLLVALTSMNAFAGAVSAGGMLAPAKLECVFVDPAQPTRPFNFIVHGKAGYLSQVDLVAQSSQRVGQYPQLIEDTRGALTLEGRGQTLAQDLGVVVDDAVAVSFEGASLLQPLVGLKDVSFVKEEPLYRSVMALGDQTLEGYCAKNYFIWYVLTP